MKLGIQKMGLGARGAGSAPASPSDILQDLQFGVESDGLTLKDNKAGANVDEPELRNANCRAFAGGTDHIIQSNGLDISGVHCKWSGSFNPSDTSGVEALISQQDGTGTGDSILYLNNTQLATRINGSQQTFIGAVFIDGPNDWELVYNPDVQTITLTLNSVQYQHTSTTAFSATGDFVWGAAKNISLPFVGTMWDCKFEVLEESLIDVILTLGDSTNVGINASPPGSLGDPQQHLYDYHVESPALATGSTVLQPVSGTIWGAELQLGADITKKSAFIKCAVSGSTLGDTWVKGGTRYSTLTTQITSAFAYFIAQGYVPRITNVVMNLGINDSVTQVNADGYYDNFLEFWDDLVADTDVPHNTPISLVRINDSLENTYASTVQDSQDSLASVMGNLTLIPSEGFGTRDDPPIHYSVQGNVDMGAAEAVLYNAITLNADEVISNYPLSGTDTTVAYDVSAYLNHGTITGTTVGDQDSYSHNHLYGFSDGVFLGDVTFQDGDIYQYESFTQIGQTVQCVSDGSSAAGVVSSTALFDFSTSTTYEVTYNLTLNSGTAPNIRSVLSTNGRSSAGNLSVTASAGENTVSFVSSTNNDRRLEFSVPTSTPTDFSIALVSIKKIGSVIPAMTSGIADASGNPITNPAGYTHNVSECDVQQVDTHFDAFGAATSFYGNGTDTWDEKTYAQIDAHYTSSNGSLGLWVKKIGENVYRMSQYSLTKDWTVGEVERNESYFGGGGAALRDVNGDLITDVNGYVIFAA